MRTPSTFGGVRKGLCELTNQSSCVDEADLAVAPVGANGSEPKGSDPWACLEEEEEAAAVGVGPNAAAKGSFEELWNSGID